MDDHPGRLYVGGRPRRVYTVEFCQELATKNGGELLTPPTWHERYRALDRLLWRCQRGHEWEAVPNEVARGSWCRRCSRSYTPEEVRVIGLESGFYVLNSLEYKTLGLKNLQVKCTQCEKTSMISLVTIQNNTGCPRCRRTHRMPDEEEGKAYAVERGGRLVQWASLSASKSMWRCKVGHQWLAAWGRMFRESAWCSKCVIRFKPETRVGAVLGLAKKAWRSYVSYDKKKGFFTSVSVDDVVSAKMTRCVYCYRTATGLDRKDNSKGHEKENCVPSCVRCNWVRGSWLTYEIMLQVGELLRTIDP